MFVVESYPLAVALCVLTMLCWGSWANTQKLASKSWPFQLFYWDWSIGVLLLALALAFTAGSYGDAGRPFLADLAQAEAQWLGSALVGGVVFNLSNLLIVAAIDVVGLAVAFPVGVGLALALGVVTTHLATGDGNVPMLALGVGLVLVAIVLDAMAYARLASTRTGSPLKGVLLAVAAGLLMGFFYSFVARSMAALEPSTRGLEPGKLSPYTAIVMFSVGVFASSFLWNTLAMRFPVVGERVPAGDYFTRGTPWLHAVGLLGGIVFNTGMSASIVASTAAGPALSYGLGQGATTIGVAWGVFVWKEFRGAPPGTGKLLAAMFAFYALGLGVLVASKL